MNFTASFFSCIVVAYFQSEYSSSSNCGTLFTDKPDSVSLSSDNSYVKRLLIILGGVGWIAWKRIQSKMQTCEACGSSFLNNQINCPICGTKMKQNLENIPASSATIDIKSENIDL